MDPHHNGYLLFCEYKRPHLPDSQWDQKDAFAKSGQFLGQSWRNQTIQQKDWWQRMASRDPNRFAGKHNPYMLFCNVIRDDLLNAQPTLTVPELGKQLGHQWRELPARDKTFWETQTQQTWK